MTTDTDQITEVDPKVLDEATRLGWTPKEKFRGDAAKWVDAQTFLDRGHQIMPILRKTNERLEGEVAASKSQLNVLTSTVKELRTALDDMTKFQADEVKRQVDSQIASLRADKTAAIKDGDHEQAALIEDQLDTLRDKKAELKVVPTAKVDPEKKTDPAAAPQWAIDWANENDSWYITDKRRTALFFGICEELRAKGMTGRQVLDKAKEELETMLDKPATQKVEGGEGGPSGRGGGSGSGGGKTFADLPAEAKEVVKAEARKMVGPNKPFKDEAAWKAHYVKVYFDNE